MIEKHLLLSTYLVFMSAQYLCVQCIAVLEEHIWIKCYVSVDKLHRFFLMGERDQEIFFPFSRGRGEGHWLSDWSKCLKSSMKIALCFITSICPMMLFILKFEQFIHSSKSIYMTCLPFYFCFIYITAMELALSLEKLTNEKLLNLHAVSPPFVLSFVCLCNEGRCLI